MKQRSIFSHSALLLLLVGSSACSRIISRPQVNPCDEGQVCRSGYTCDPGELICVLETGAECVGVGREALCSRDVGECKLGQRTCKSGAYTECSGVMPEVEVCDGLDNDCDGESDESFTELGQRCSLGRGICTKEGVMACDASGSVSCNAVPASPQAETCNNMDDDCDGVVDNNPIDAPLCPLQAGVCQGSKAACLQGKFEQCSNASYGADYDASIFETRCDGKDNDCDGAVDEGYILRPQDIEVTEVVACPQQTWNDVLDPVTMQLAPGGNGIPFDDVPATGDLDASKVLDHTWFEIENRISCPVSLSNLRFYVGASEGSLAELTPLVTRAKNGEPCSELSKNERCVIAGPASLRGSDTGAFTRMVRVSRSDGTALDTLSAQSASACATTCRLGSVRRQPLSPCCEGESFSTIRETSGMRSLVVQAATPLWPNDVRETYRPPLTTPGTLDGELRFTEAFALASALDVNGDAVASTDEDEFLELATVAARTIDLGRMRLIDEQRGGNPELHTFACFAPVDGARRVVVFGGARAALPGSDFRSAMTLTSSRGPSFFSLSRSTAMSLVLENRNGADAARLELSATSLDGASVQSRMRCGSVESTVGLACDCRCRGADASCVPMCTTACESPNALDGCFDPG